MKRTRVETVMSHRPITVGRQAPYKEIVAALLANQISAVPVLDDMGHVVGVVSDADLVLKDAVRDVAPDGHRFATLRSRRERRKSRGSMAAELMSVPAITVPPKATVDEAAELMRKHRVRRLPVTEPVSGWLVGIVSRSDLLRQYLRADEEIGAEIYTEVLPKALSMDPRQFTVTVREGVVSIVGEVERRSLVPGVVEALHEVEGVVAVDHHLTYQHDDRNSVAPTFW